MFEEQKREEGKRGAKYQEMDFLIESNLLLVKNCQGVSQIIVCVLLPLSVGGM